MLGRAHDADGLARPLVRSGALLFNLRRVGILPALPDASGSILTTGTIGRRRVGSLPVKEHVNEVLFAKEDLHCREDRERDR